MGESGDPSYVDVARFVEQLQSELDPVSGEELESLAKEIVAQPPDVVERMKKLLGI